MGVTHIALEPENSLLVFPTLQNMELQEKQVRSYKVANRGLLINHTIIMSPSIIMNTYTFAFLR